jgi:MFS family permease
LKRSRYFKFYKPNIFYGWYIVLGLGTVSMVSTGMGGINFGLFLPPMCGELGISQAYFGWAYSARLIGFSLTSVYLGILLDRYGARIPMAITGFLAGLVMLGLSRLQSGWQLVTLFFVLGMIGLEGAGGNLFQSVPLSRWFLLKRGRAMSLALVGMTAGIFFFTPLSEFLIASQGWRSAWLFLGCGGSLVVVVVALVVIRKDPQSMGLYPDGIAPSEAVAPQCGIVQNQEPPEYSWQRPDAIRTYAFWALVTIHGLRMLSISTLHVFRIPFYIEQGIAPHLVAWAISMEAIVAAVVALIAGKAADRFQPRFVVAASLALFCITFIVTMRVHTAWHVFAAAAIYGASASTYIVATNALWPNFFGSTHIGSIRGLSLVITVLFSTAGAPISGAVKDITGSYFPAWIGAIFMLGAATVLMLITKKPQPPLQTPIQCE